MKLVGINENRCPKCRIKVMDQTLESVKERHISVLLDEKRRRELEGTYMDIRRDGNGFVLEDCDLCGAFVEDIVKQIKLDFSNS